MNDWVTSVRSSFPGIVSSPSWVFCDAATGTQYHQSVVDAISLYLSSPTANLAGDYPSAVTTRTTVVEAREAAATFLNCSTEEVTFGANMTTLTMHISRSLSKIFGHHNNVVVTNLDHDGNVSPWVLAARDAGSELRRVDFKKDDCLLDLVALEASVDSNTALVAVGGAANSCGSITDIKKVCQIVKKASFGKALVYVDAVHLAPHILPDVKDLGCDFLVCSSYKFCGPHMGLLYGRKDLMLKLDPYRLSACTDQLPGPKTLQASRWETGTANFECLSGVTAVLKYLASIGDMAGLTTPSQSLRQRLVAGYKAIYDHETSLTERFLKGACDIPGLTLYGAKADKINQRTPTFAVRMKNFSRAEYFSDYLVEKGIACGSGHFYALNMPKILGLESSGGYTRISFYHYHTLDEVDKVIAIIKEAATV